MKTGSVFIPSVKDSKSVLIIWTAWKSTSKNSSLTFDGINTAVCWTYVFFSLTRPRVPICFFNRLTVKSLRCRSRWFWRSSSKGDMARCLWFSRRGRSGTRLRQVGGLDGPTVLLWCHWIRTPARATWPRQRGRTQISSKVRVNWLAGHITVGCVCFPVNLFRHRIRLNATSKTFHWTLCFYCWKKKKSLEMFQVVSF